VVDEAGGLVDVHSVINVLAENELWVEPDLVALGVVFDCSFALFDLLGVLFDLISALVMKSDSWNLSKFIVLPRRSNFSFVIITSQ